MARHEDLNVTRISSSEVRLWDEGAGGPDSNGAWKITINTDGDLSFSKKVSGSWVEAQAIAPAE